MVLRKPYAFLIKYFKLIHILITGLLVLIVLNFNKVNTFLSSVMSNNINRHSAENYISNGILIAIILVLGLLFLIFWLFRYKNKPKFIYIVSLTGYTFIFIFMLILHNYLGNISMSVIDAKTIRIYRDIIFMVNIYQYLIIAFMFVRGLGFNIKKFDFDKDAQELKLTAEDNEEIAIDINVDTTDVKRFGRKITRELGYFYQEFKGIIIGIGIVLIIVFVILGYNIYNNHFKVYKEGEYVGENNYIKINNSYYNIADKGYYVIIDFSTYVKGKKRELNLGNIVLKISDKTYLPSKNQCYLFSNMGYCYKQQIISSNESKYLLVYKVDEINAVESYIDFIDSYDKRFKIKLNIKSK